MELNLAANRGAIVLNQDAFGQAPDHGGGGGGGGGGGSGDGGSGGSGSGVHRVRAELDELITFANIANDECDFGMGGMGLQLGLDLLAFARRPRRRAAAGSVEGVVLPLSLTPTRASLVRSNCRRSLTRCSGGSYLPMFWRLSFRRSYA